MGLLKCHYEKIINNDIEEVKDLKGIDIDLLNITDLKDYFL